MTKEGNILVDGVLASCYATCNHDLAHAVVTPILWFPEMTALIFGQDQESLDYVKFLKDVMGAAIWAKLWRELIRLRNRAEEYETLLKLY